MDNYKGAQRLQGLDKQNPQIDLKPLSQQLKATNIGSGDPTWKPPNFYLEALKEQVDQGNHQYVRSFGSIQLVKAIAKFHEKNFHPHKIDPLNEIVTTNGASQALFCCFIALLNPGDEAIFFDPAYDCYRSQIHMAGGKAIGIPLKPKKTHKKQQLKQRINDKNQIRTSQQDQWSINFSQLQNALSQKTKILLINSPHHPVGKVFTQEQYKKIANLLQKYPRIVVIEDNVYEGIVFDQLLGKRLPKIIYQPNMYDRTVSVYTSGNILAATGARLGWAIGSSKIIQSIRSVHTYNVFCTYNVIQNAIAKSLQKISDEKDTYLVDYAKKLQNLRNILVKQLVNSKLDIDLWIPKGSNFLIADISRCQIKQKYLHDEKGKKLPRDHAFSLQLMQQKGVYVVPCSNFYDQKNVEDCERYVQFAFCKDQQIIKEAISKLNKNN